MNEQILQPICTLHIKLSEIDATADLLYNSATVGDIDGLDKPTIESAMSNIQSMAKECKKAVGEIEQVSHSKPDVSESDDGTDTGEETPTRQGMNQPLINSWLELTNCDELTDTSLSDALGTLFDSAISTLGTTALYLHQNERSLSIDNPAALLRMLERQMMDGKTLVDHWWKTIARHRNDDQPAWMNFPIEEMEKLTQEDIDFALKYQQSSEQEKRAIDILVESLKQSQGTDKVNAHSLKPQLDRELCIKRGELLSLCCNTLRQLKAIGDLLMLSTEHGDPAFFDDTLESIGQLIANSAKSTLEEINPEPVSEEEEAA